MNTRLLSYLLLVTAMAVLPTSLRAQFDDPFGSTPGDATPAAEEAFGSTPSGESTPASDDPFGQTPTPATPSSDDPSESTSGDAGTGSSAPVGDASTGSVATGDTTSDGSASSSTTSGSASPRSDNSAEENSTSDGSSNTPASSSPNTVSKAELQAELSALETRLKLMIQSSIASAMSSSGLASGSDSSSDPQTPDIEDPSTPPAETDVDARIEALTQLIADQGTIQAQLQQDISQLTQVVNDQKAIVEAITRTNSEGKPILSLGNMDSTEFRQEMKGAIYRSLEQGELIVVNKTIDRRELLVNGMRFLVEPSETKTIRVGVGKITTELVGYEGTKEWTIKEPDYKQTIHIIPSDTTTAGGLYEWVQYGNGWILVRR